MDEPRLFHVAPDAIHLRLQYEPLTNTWTLHHALVRRTSEGEVWSDPAEPYRYLCAEEARDVAQAVIETSLGFG